MLGELIGGQAGANSTLMATVAAGTSDALWKRGELSSFDYLAAMGVAARVYCGRLSPEEGRVALMAIWMGPVGDAALG